MAKVEPELAKLLAGDPSERLEVIVTASDSLDDLLPLLSSEIEVMHEYGLIQAAAVRASAGALLELSKLPAVAAIEPVRAVGSW